MAEKDYVLQPLDELVSEPLALCEGTEPTPNEESVLDKAVFYTLLPVSIAYAGWRLYELITSNYHAILEVGEAVSTAIENIP